MRHPLALKGIKSIYRYSVQLVAKYAFRCNSKLIHLAPHYVHWCMRKKTTGVQYLLRLRGGRAKPQPLFLHRGRRGGRRRRRPRSLNISKTTSTAVYAALTVKLIEVADDLNFALTPTPCRPTCFSRATERKQVDTSFCGKIL